MKSEFLNIDTKEIKEKARCAMLIVDMGFSLPDNVFNIDTTEFCQRIDMAYILHKRTCIIPKNFMGMPLDYLFSLTYKTFN